MVHAQVKKSVRNKNNVPMTVIMEGCRKMKADLINDILGSRKTRYTRAVLERKNLNRLKEIWEKEA